jgi:transposase InsO family protein
MNRKIKARLHWVKLYREIGNAGIVCRRCGISRPTLRKWLRRYAENGIEGLKDKSKRPKTSPAKKVTLQHEEWILELRKKRKLGVRRIQSELIRHYNCSFSLATIHKVLKRNGVGPLKKIRRKKEYKRYQRPIPGDRVQLDTCKIGPNLYQYTAIDDCTRYRVLGLYKRRTAANTLRFLEKLFEEMPFPVQRIQTDRGNEFFAIKVQNFLMDWCIRFRPIRPGAPHLNGKVERSQRTDLEEFYPTVEISDPDLEDRLQEWQHYYNWDRPHGSLKGASPMDKFFDLIKKTPYWDQVEMNYCRSNERIREQNYRRDLQLKKMKGSV